MTSQAARPRHRARILAAALPAALTLTAACGALAGPAAAAPLSALPAPTGVTAKAAPGAVTLGWRAVAKASSYAVTRTNADKHVVRTPTKATSLVDRTTKPGASYTYRVVAIDAGGRSTATSAAVRVKGPAAAPVGTPAPAPAPAPIAPVAPTAPVPPATSPAPPVTTPAVPSPATTPAPPTAAPALAAATRFVRPGGASSGSCTAAAPCGSFEAAWRAASAGDVVEVAAGDYAGGTLGPVSRGIAPVTFRPAPGARVSAGQLAVTGSHLEVRDVTLRGWYAKPGSTDLTFRDVTTTAAFFITSASHISVLGGSVGPGDSVDPQIKASDTNGAPVPSDILIDGVDFHDFTRSSDPTAHVECLQFGAGRRIVVQRSTFRNCATQGVFFRSWGGTASISDVVFENNVLGATSEGFYGLRISDNGQRYPNIRVAYNSSVQPFSVDASVIDGLQFVGNVAPKRAGTCEPGATFSHDVWDGTTCSGSDRNAATGFLNPGGVDLALQGGAAAQGAGDPADHPATDRLGRARPATGPVDAGAYEG